MHNDGGWCYTAGSTLTELPVLCGDADGRGGGGAIRCEVHPSASGEPTAVTDMTCGSSSDSASRNCQLHSTPEWLSGGPRLTKLNFAHVVAELQDYQGCVLHLSKPMQSKRTTQL